MEIKTIEQIKEEEAINHGWENYNHALDAANAGVINGFSFADLWEDVAIQYASQFQTNTTELEDTIRELATQLELKVGHETNLIIHARELIKKHK